MTLPHHWKPLVCARHRCCSNLPRDGKTPVDRFRAQVSRGPSFQDFIKGVSVHKPRAEAAGGCDSHAYLSEDLSMGDSRKGASARRNPLHLQLLGLNSNPVYVLCVCVCSYQCILKPMGVK